MRKSWPGLPFEKNANANQEGAAFVQTEGPKVYKYQNHS